MPWPAEWIPLMVFVGDLLEQPHEPLRCLGFVLLALKRIFPDFAPGEIPSTSEEARAWLSSPPAARWVEIGRNAFKATKVGDVLYGEDGSQDGAYVAVLVDPNGGGFLTSDSTRGPHIRTRRQLKGVLSVQRRVA